MYKIKTLIGSIALFATTIGITTAQAYPLRHITLIVPYTAGGTADGIGRALGQHIGNQLNTTVIVENKPGAGASIGAEYVAKSPKDGHTLLLASTSALTIYPHIGQPKYEALVDFIPLASVAISPVALAVPKQITALTFDDLLDKAKVDPNFLRYGTPGVGTNAHLGIERLSRKINANLTHVPYKGNSQALTDAVGGAFELLVTNADVVLPHAQTDALRPVAVMAPERLKAWPEVPTLSELGYNEAQYYSDFGLFVPAGTPMEIVERLEQVIQTALADESYQDFLAKTHNLKGVGVGDQYAQTIRNQYEQNAIVIKEAGIVAE